MCCMSHGWLAMAQAAWLKRHAPPLLLLLFS
jgi:hypothetical protein